VLASIKAFYYFLMFAGKAGPCPSEALYRCSTLGYAPDLIHKYQAMMERLAGDKRSSLLQTFENFGRKKVL
jgi:hypothetical protein